MVQYTFVVFASLSFISSEYIYSVCNVKNNKMIMISRTYLEAIFLAPIQFALIFGKIYRKPVSFTQFAANLKSVEFLRTHTNTF